MKKLMIANSSGGGIAGTLDSSYYKGQGERQGIEREYVVVYGSDFDRDDINKEHNCGGGGYHQHLHHEWGQGEIK